MGKPGMALLYAGAPLYEITHADGFYFIYLLIFGCDGSSLLLRLSSVAETQGYSIAEVGPLLTVVSFVAAQAVGPMGFSGCSRRLSCPMAY